MTYKVHPRNQYSYSPAERRFDKLMQKIFKPTLERQVTPETNHVDNLPPCALSKVWLKLSDEQRELLTLYVAKGLTSAQIAERTQQSRAAVRRTLSEAYAQLLQVDCT